MKANENLMVGDWVKFKGSDLYHQVKVVSNKSIKFDNQKWFAKSSVEPIPLTAEILEKNGWVKTKYAYCRDCMEIHGAGELPEGVDNALSMAMWSIDKNYQYHFLDLYMWKGGVKQYDVHYVHQLQHAFRIFGIEVEIIL